MAVDFPFVGGSYTSRSLNWDAQRSVNLYPVLSESGTSRSVAMLTTTPGHRKWLDVGAGPIRGELKVAGVLLVVSGSKLYRVSAGKVVTEVGAVAGSGLVGMASNGKQVMIVTGASSPGYFLTIATWTLKKIDTTEDPDGSFTGAETVDFLDGRFVWPRPGTGEFAVSQLYGTKIDALEFATAEGSPDNLVGQIADHRELWLFGESTTEVWYTSGDPDFPLARISNAFIEHGCAAPKSITKLDNTVFWLGADDRGQGILWRANGYTPQRVSTFPIEEAWEEYARIDDAIAFTYQQAGHSFYVISFPSADATWVYDVAANLWHERSWRESTGLNKQHRVRGHVHAHFAGEHLVGDHATGRLYALDLNHFRDEAFGEGADGELIPRIRVAPYIEGDGNRRRVHSMQIVMETGVGLVDGQGSDPQAMLQWSDDGAHTWSNEHWTTLGRIGERRTRAMWRRLGAARDRVFRVLVTDPVPVNIIKARMEVS
ncbi:hypothetical protein P245_25750 [Comamonas thiooxydans]|uniref:Phage stabilization protein n=1 Tax=Comamonas thiooxydans TaxID=363952 RepID=A0A0E3BDK4_9BURK|nr:packaged DNA stabilization protein [Comamonas thiooxydans]KGG83033.1 hypothetical protein P245_25750 [Comamonas thiooxydans]